MLIASYFPVVVTLGLAMADRTRGDIDDADEIIARSVADMQLAGISDSAIGAALMLRSMMLWRTDGLTDDEIVCEFGKCIQLPFGRNAPPARIALGSHEPRNSRAGSFTGSGRTA